MQRHWLDLYLCRCAVIVRNPCQVTILIMQKNKLVAYSASLHSHRIIRKPVHCRFPASAMALIFYLNTDNSACLQFWEVAVLG